jgi:hypothetical protein
VHIFSNIDIYFCIALVTMVPLSLQFSFHIFVEILKSHMSYCLLFLKAEKHQRFCKDVHVTFENLNKYVKRELQTKRDHCHKCNAKININITKYMHLYYKTRVEQDNNIFSR